MIVSSTKKFRDALRQLYKKPKHNYISCKVDICNELDGKDVTTLTKSNVQLLKNETRYALKIRVAHSSLKLSKSNGFRLIAFADTQTDEICLLYVYPKRGPLQTLDIGDNFLVSLLQEYEEERGANTLVKMDIHNELTEIEPSDQ
ncbi:hypothetical protein [Spirosoma montaniterrae]|uniref:Uncharacterized protein n=1 Tax=Spirosoma montaniterrae TaxID=1178516 RepID=A0A1P9WXD1_9BACT|nr:hypothetical protein [Spirosoma montaniterrae]AQG80046.1 hypothetical protein AWR27_12360 [Spirosoma montaniterrae]